MQINGYPEDFKRIEQAVMTISWFKVSKIQDSHERCRQGIFDMLGSSLYRQKSLSSHEEEKLLK